MSQYSVNHVMYCRPFEIIEKIGPVGYRRDLWNSVFGPCQQSGCSEITCFWLDPSGTHTYKNHLGQPSNPIYTLI